MFPVYIILATDDNMTVINISIVNVRVIYKLRQKFDNIPHGHYFAY